ncbi:GIY-YIG nuclease family protein [Vibrio parahaemolyticus]|uniref:GIY-YIG nuclease family protein n=1 Tax=Vibrio campbellii TaxID=680 RepID=UPI000CD363DE|nr:GIY-YIG nuclease family protein [Vibrio campbellii]ELA8128011.1 helix-turn-helix domain-containing protein [Vibrio parahaemolyticus]AUV85896.1 hypothetical protein C1N50_06860 [Vibrio campbellii]ELA8147257.1 helix-turn-helix domain-containing protein [Vibrio parahaemolyticus]ELA8182264.1 helix-turn-helix domain-containing protein [Vibrio parahaemolyticus]ELB2732801.1 helix-turn-helix domain-containing protein [Vibrio parahaemolyticus]
MSSGNQIYVIGPSGGPLKIGIASDVKSRRSILNVGNHLYLRIFHIHDAGSPEEAKRLENELHYHFKDTHIRGEWFDLSERDLPQVKQLFHSLILFTDSVPKGWTLARKGCDEFTPEVCKKARGALGIELSELAEKAGLTESTVANFESNATSPSIDTVEALKSTFETLGVEFIREQAGKCLRILV